MSDTWYFISVNYDGFGIFQGGVLHAAVRAENRDIALRRLQADSDVWSRAARFDGALKLDERTARVRPTHRGYKRGLILWAENTESAKCRLAA